MAASQGATEKQHSIRRYILDGSKLDAAAAEFRIFDVASTGRIHAKECRLALKNLDVDVNSTCITDLLLLANVQQQGKVRYEQYLEVLVTIWVISAHLGHISSKIRNESNV